MKKATVTIHANHINASKNFEARIQKVLPEWVNQIEVTECGMQRAGGYGQYKYFITGYVNDETPFHCTRHTTDSRTWDWYDGCEVNRTFENWKKNLIISMLEDYFETV